MTATRAPSITRAGLARAGGFFGVLVATPVFGLEHWALNALVFALMFAAPWASARPPASPFQDVRIFASARSRDAFKAFSNRAAGSSA